MTAALEVQDLWFHYGRREAVHGVSLSLQPGDCYGFLGHNGAGKTTVLRLCLGLLTPERGTVRMFGIDAHRAPRLARAAVGALVERPGCHAGASAWQNLAWLARLQGMPRALARAESSRALDRVGLGAVAHRRVATFSLGMRQRLGVAQALLGNPRLLLLDEPTNGLDPEGIADLRLLLRQLARDDGVAVLLSSHQLQELEGLCNRIGVLREGRMVVEGDVATLRRQLQSHHVVAGTPLPVLAAQLQALGLQPETAGDQLRVDLCGRAPGTVVRQLAEAGELTQFAPEPVTLEAIYRHAASLDSAAAAPADAPAPFAPPDAGATLYPRWRAFTHELRTLGSRATTPVLLALPAAAAVWSVLAHRQQVASSLARVQQGELFSADGGSGQLAVAQALQAAVPVLGIALVWLASQSLAADLARDTLRNTLMRSVTRSDVLVGKFAALGVAGLGALLLTVAAAAAVAAACLGFGDLEEVTRHGDRQRLAAAADVSPVLWQAVRHCVLPLLGVAAVAFAASSLARRPARALLLALAAVLAPELLRSRLGEHAGWLLTSHLPTGLRDDSVLGYAASIARGAADANWPWADSAVQAPLAWLAAALTIAWLQLRRLRIP